MSLNPGVIILGFTGSIGSGCTFISEMIPKVSANEYKYFKLSDIIREILKDEGIENPTVQQLQDRGDDLRLAYHKNFLVEKLLTRLRDDDSNSYEKIVIDGIKNTGEVDYLRQLPNFYLFSINADRETRSSRVVGSRFATISEFEGADTRDQFEEASTGQQVKECNDLSDIIIVNEKHIVDTATRKKEDYVRDIYRKYVKLIEDSVSGGFSPEISPSINELCMTISYSLSKKSSCLKRKVGSVVVDIDKSISPVDGQQRVNDFPYIISSGYNEVPMGSQKCIFHEEFRKCYRDHLQEEHAKKMKFCPSCGEPIDVKTTCPFCAKQFGSYVKFCPDCKKEIKSTFKCPSCDKKVFEEFLPGSKQTPGKLLDMCRSLHAEEMAILRLSKTTGNRSGDLVLFATTQPCNLCANKIVSAGIKKVVFSEPYTMKEAAEILKKGGVTLERFEGVKSSAYFKLYA